MATIVAIIVTVIIRQIGLGLLCEPLKPEESLKETTGRH